MSDTLLKTPLYDLHVELGAKIVPFAGYEMPVQYPMGVMKEHLHTRESAGLFDVSHMGQAWLIGENVATDLETLVPADIEGLQPGQQRYTQLLDENGCILDDLMVTRPADPALQDRLFLIVNAACKDQDYAHIAQKLGDRVKIERMEDRGLIALQGPKAVDVMARLAGDQARTMAFMAQDEFTIDGITFMVSRSGYTGEDGYEISVAGDQADALARRILAEEECAFIGLGARDSLRLEGGLCLYGHDIDTTTTPIEAGLIWSIAKRRRNDGGFPGADIIRAQISEGITRKRVGIKPEGRAPAREGTEITNQDGVVIGNITSGGFGPTVGGPVAMGYVSADQSAVGNQVFLVVRGKSMPAEIIKMPFTPARFYRG